METTSRLVLDQFWLDLGLAPFRSFIETRTFESNLALVTQTPFISIVPESLARRHERFKLIKILNVKPELPASAAMLVYNKAIKDDMLLESCRELIHEATHDSLKNHLLA
jgi:DNA-binding transcriptional LysR family regulator